MDTICLVDADTILLLDPDTIALNCGGDVPGSVLTGITRAGVSPSGRASRALTSAHGKAGTATTGRRGVASVFIRKATVEDD